MKKSSPLCLRLELDQKCAVPIPVPTLKDTVTRPVQLFKSTNHSTYWTGGSLRHYIRCSTMHCMCVCVCVCCRQPVWCSVTDLCRLTVCDCFDWRAALWKNCNIRLLKEKSTIKYLCHASLKDTVRRQLRRLYLQHSYERRSAQKQRDYIHVTSCSRSNHDGSKRGSHVTLLWKHKVCRGRRSKHRTLRDVSLFPFSTDSQRWSLLTITTIVP